MSVKTLSALVPPNMTTTQRNAIPAGRRPPGAVIFNTTTDQIEVNIGSDATPVWAGSADTELAGGTFATTASAGGTGNLLYDFGSITFDGSTAIEIYLSAPYCISPAGGQADVRVFDFQTGSDVSGNRLCFFKNGTTGEIWWSVAVSGRFTPSAGAKRYRLRFETVAGSASILQSIDGQPCMASLRKVAV